MDIQIVMCQYYETQDSVYCISTPEKDLILEDSIEPVENKRK